MGNDFFFAQNSLKNGVHQPGLPDCWSAGLLACRIGGLPVYPKIMIIVDTIPNAPANPTLNAITNFLKIG
jgi:hypothetical protein